jgi:hypothetical protein
MNRLPQTTTRTLLALCIICTAAALAQDLVIDWHTIDGGGAMASSGGGFEVSGTIGQGDAGPAAGPLTGGGFELIGGFWPAAAGVAVLGDSDGDGDVDLDDYMEFAGTCLSGPDVGADPGCAYADFDGDGNVDLFDFTAFQEAFTG